MGSIVEVPSKPELDAPQLTVEAWVNPKTFTAWTSLATFIQDNSSFEYGWGLGIYAGLRRARQTGSYTLPPNF